MTNHPFKTGGSREQSSFLPPRVEDYVDRDNPVRAIDAFVDALNLATLGFRYPKAEGGPGQPAYDPADLLKLYLYGYLNRVRSSRSLEREARRNLEVIWLLNGLDPGYRTIANFRRDNSAALKAANRNFVLVARELELVGGTVVAIDGAFFDGNASKASITTRKKLEERLAAVDRDIAAYEATLNENDAAEDKEPPAGTCAGTNIAQKMASLMTKRAKLQASLTQLEASGETQLSRTDQDARLLTKSGQRVAGYNVQIAVDEKHKLIVASEVVNDANDSHQLHSMAKAAKEELGTEALTALADTGYYNCHDLKACEDDGIVAYVPQGNRTSQMEAQGRFSHEAFVYEAENDVYHCPAGKLLSPNGRKVTAAGRVDIRYRSRKSDCDTCTLRSRCVTARTPTRTIQRWEHEAVLERHRARMQDAESQMRQRAAWLNILLAPSNAEPGTAISWSAASKRSAGSGA